ncbi:MAG: hydrogenase [Candidatus Methanomethylicota archaeon]|mgnify:CR=1 FL=1|uniref:Hydrogenase n=1 Tax=Thermoproteota archaeon TaxID=2056631 RepID=A0A497EQK6_9CREN|nr:MAG: hydrogenase [Candidatus Verstraetearchaeota archaeon]RLE53451.1 MAG: hydrogenase [Candidatus Verstraetearchaeota archaeon]
MKKVLVAGFGNILLGDEGVGIHVIRELQKLNLPPHVEVVDLGVNSTLLIDIFPNYDKIIIVDALVLTGKPGEVQKLSAEELLQVPRSSKVSLHEIDLPLTLEVCKQLYGSLKEVKIIGIEVEADSLHEVNLRLSSKAESAVKKAVCMILDELGVVNV